MQVVRLQFSGRLPHNGRYNVRSQHQLLMMGGS